MAADASLKAWLSLSLIKGLGGKGARHLLKEFGSPEAVFFAPIHALKTIVKANIASKISDGVDEELLTETLSWLNDANNHLVTLADQAYPQALLNIPDPPMLLYIKGRLDQLNHPAIGIVGSRNATHQGINNAEAFANTLSDAGLCIISGMAHGIDAAAHRGGLKGQGGSIAIVGTGLDKVYPSPTEILLMRSRIKVL